MQFSEGEAVGITFGALAFLATVAVLAFWRTTSKLTR